MVIADYCRDVETYLCRKNDGHLIRIVGPSFDRVSSWAEQGVPLKVVFAGIDRYFERYYRNGPRRRPVKIDFCEADVLDVFDEWRRAIGFQTRPDQAAGPEPRAASQESLAKHLERAVMRLTSALASGAVGDELGPVTDRAAAALDRARSKAGGLRGADRAAVIEELARLDVEMMAIVRGRLDPEVARELDREALDELASFRAAMAPDAFARAREAAVDRLLRMRFGLPTISFTQG